MELAYNILCRHAPQLLGPDAQETEGAFLEVQLSIDMQGQARRVKGFSITLPCLRTSTVMHMTPLIPCVCLDASMAHGPSEVPLPALAHLRFSVCMPGVLVQCPCSPACGRSRGARRWGSRVVWSC